MSKHNGDKKTGGMAARSVQETKRRKPTSVQMFFVLSAQPDWNWFRRASTCVKCEDTAVHLGFILIILLL